ncbi:hypothetical protein QR680_010128 [Steinernema hermaphroditum]|uniref:Uncharacterized protein n=1 Tax=Steinernema hermaphroditum TaxID=289476 RepID=A0AA39IMV2_9BILA|nr:hypothetical protein QR680_010128 [Steinernema hermaphroditum]
MGSFCSRRFNENGLPKKGCLIFETICAYLMYPLLLAFETVSLLQIRRNPPPPERPILPLIGIPLLLWCFVSVTALACLVKKQVKHNMNYCGGRWAQRILNNYLFFQCALIIFTFPASCMVLHRLESHNVLVGYIVQGCIIGTQIRLVLFFSRYRKMLKKVGGTSTNSAVSRELTPKQRTVYVITPADCHQPWPTNDGLPSYNDVMGSNVKICMN